MGFLSCLPIFAADEGQCLAGAHNPSTLGATPGSATASQFGVKDSTSTAAPDAPPRAATSLLVGGGQEPVMGTAADPASNPVHSRGGDRDDTPASASRSPQEGPGEYERDRRADGLLDLRRGYLAVEDDAA